MKPKPIRILVVDDHFLLRLGLIGAISAEPDIEVVAEASNGLEAITLFELHQPDVTLMDGILPDIHGVEVTRQILAKHPAARIILVSINDTAEDVNRAIQAGAWGYIPKSCEKSAIVKAIRAVAGGERFLAPELAKKLAERDLLPLLSAREVEVLHLVAKGMPNKQIAAELAISEATIKTHIAHILEKLDVSDRTHAVIMAMERGILRT